MDSGLTSLIDAFALPASARVEQRIAKKLLVEQGAATAANRRLINDAVEAIVWHAALKPATIGVPASTASPDSPAVIELALVSLSLRAGTRAAQAQRLVQLIHRAIPYPVLLLVDGGGRVNLSLAVKRASLGEVGQLVVQALCESGAIDAAAPTPIEGEFLASLGLHRLPRADLAALYQGVIDRVTALQAARITGRYGAPGATAAPAAQAQREALAEWRRLAAEIATASAAAAKEGQLARRVELNLKLQGLRAEQQQAQARLAP